MNIEHRLSLKFYLNERTLDQVYRNVAGVRFFVTQTSAVSVVSSRCVYICCTETSVVTANVHTTHTTCHRLTVWTFIADLAWIRRPILTLRQTTWHSSWDTRGFLLDCLPER